MLSLLFSVAVLLSSCTHHFILEDISTIQKGMSSEEVNELVLRTPRNSATVVYKNTEYLIERHRITLMIFSNGVNNNYEKFYFLYSKDNKLLFWGFAKDFSSSDDQLFSGIGDLIKTQDL